LKFKLVPLYMLDWSKLSVKIPERDAGRVLEILRAIPTEVVVGIMGETDDPDLKPTVVAKKTNTSI
jgi:Tat protein secretion system quality control protein TatD with DNase activity